MAVRGDLSLELLGGDETFEVLRTMNFRSRAPRCSPIRTQMLTDLQSSSWQEKLYSSFCVIKYLILAMLGVEAALAFFIILRLRIAWVSVVRVFGTDSG